MENRNGLAVQAAKRGTASQLIDRHAPQVRRVTLTADQLVDVESFVTGLRARKVTPHIAIDGRISNMGVVRKTSVDGRTTHHPG